MGLFTVFLTITLTKIFRITNTTILILAGIIMSSFMGSILAILKYWTNDDAILSSITYWLMGSFSNAKLKNLYFFVPIVSIGLVPIILLRWKINIIALGKEAAETRGLNYKVLRLVIILIATILTATSVAFSGVISWVGLIIPHIVRLLVGKNTKYSIPLVISFGANFMILTDILARSFTAQEIPLSAITGIFTAIIFLLVMFFNKRQLNEYQN